MTRYVYEVRTLHDRDNNLGDWINDEECVYATREQAQAVVDEREAAARARHEAAEDRRQADRDREQREHDALVAAGLRQPREWPPIRRFEYRSGSQWDVQEIEVIEPVDEAGSASVVAGTIVLALLILVVIYGVTVLNALTQTPR